MAEGSSRMDRFKSYKPTKSMVAWSFVGGAVATLIVGFAALDWKTGGTAQSMARSAATEARAELAASLCVERFMAAPDAGGRLAALKEESRWARDGVLEDGGWVTFAGAGDPVEDAADLCAVRLVELDAPVVETMEPEDAALQDG
ncbi:MAG: hypothetical protein RID91_22840 [Azospirillaceae bacterium]